MKKALKSIITGIDAKTPENEIGILIDTIKLKSYSQKALTQLLDEQNHFYTSRSTNEVNRIRGYILASFEEVGLPHSTIPFVLEELQNGHNAYLVAAAAKALRGYASPSESMDLYLHQAVKNIKSQDDAICFDTYQPQWPVTNYTTALQEIFKTFGWLGVHAKKSLEIIGEYYEDRYNEFTPAVKKEIHHALECINNDPRTPNVCCETFLADSQINLYFNKKGGQQENKNIFLEDQNKITINYDVFFKGKPTIIVFFYTRCDNPNKCSLTINKLAELQKIIIAENLEEKIRLAGISYDADYDLPFRLKAYGENRSLMFTEDIRLFRVTSGFSKLKERFDLGVSYSSSIVNRHRTELFISDKNGKITYAFSRLQWDSADVIKKVKEHLNRKNVFKINNFFKLIRLVSVNFINSVIPIMVAFFPKCPFCWAAYLSMFGITGFKFIHYSPNILIVLLCAMGINLLVLYVRGRKRRLLIPFYLTFLGVSAVIVNIEIRYTPLLYSGFILIVIGSLLNALPLKFYQRYLLSMNNVFHRRL